MRLEKYITEKKFELYVDDDNRSWGIDNSKEISKAQQDGQMLVAIGGTSKPKLLQWEFLSLNSFDKDWVKDAKVKAGEHILRIATRGGHSTPLVKLNVQKGLLYFLTDRANEEDIVEFEKKGTKLEYLRIIKSFKQ